MGGVYNGNSEETHNTTSNHSKERLQNISVLFAMKQNISLKKIYRL